MTPINRSRALAQDFYVREKKKEKKNKKLSFGRHPPPPSPVARRCLKKMDSWKQNSVADLQINHGALNEDDSA